jgi:probable rRNA maturation factor
LRAELASKPRSGDASHVTIRVRDVEETALVVTVLNRQRSRVVSSRAIEGFLRKIGTQVPPISGAGVGVCLVSDRVMREYNRRFRGISSTTDVLSFPDDGNQPGPEEPYLGDIVISVPAAWRQAREAGHGLARELKILALHGYLHLMGYDHETDDGTMVRIERRLIRRCLPLSRRRTV